MIDITVPIADAMYARIMLERAGVNVIFTKSTQTTSTFFFKGNGKKRERIALRLKAQGIAPISKKSYLNKTLKRRPCSL